MVLQHEDVVGIEYIWYPSNIFSSSVLLPCILSQFLSSILVVSLVLIVLSDERKKPPKFACRLQLSVSDTSQFKLYRETHWATPISFKIQ